MAERVTGVDVLWVALIVLIVVGGGLALRRARRLRASTGLPTGRIIYADTGAWRRPPAPFFSKTYQLVGKPDYIVETRAGLIPVEVKSGAAPPQPYASHVLQLAAYCLLIEDTQARSPGYGLIRYADGVVRVDYTPELRRQVVALLASMRAQRTSRDVPRSHQEARRCATCGYAEVCGQALSGPA